MDALTIDARKVTGWAVDADPRNDPTYPYRDRSKDDGLAVDWERPTEQTSDVEILSSIEYSHRPAVFGTAVPPSGLSGVIRRGAFRYSESHWLHWLMLMGADRINVVEGVLQDLVRGRIPNIPGEMGVSAEWKYNKLGLAKKAIVLGGIVAVLAAAARRDRNRSFEVNR